MSDPSTAEEVEQPELVLTEVRVRDFRGIADLWLPLDRDTSLLVGENNAGKTSVLDAIGVGLGRRGSPDDLRIGPDGAPVSHYTVDVRIEPRVGLAFDDTLAAWAVGAVQLPDDEGVPEFLAIRVEGRHNTLQGRIDDARTFLKGWQRDDEDGDPPIPLERPLISSLIREALLFQYLDARRDAAEDLRTRSSYWGRLVGDLGLSEDLTAELFGELAKLGRKVVGGSAVLGDVRTEIQRSVSALAPGAGTVELKPLPTATDHLARSMDVMISSPDSPEISLSRQGMGARSLAVLMIFQAFARRRLGPRADLPTLSVTAFEEPEAHLHPHGAKAVAPLIVSVPGQKVVSSHSSHLASTFDLQQARVLRRQNGDVSAHWLSDAAAQEISNRPAVAKLVMGRQSDVLFARLVVIVEGETEQRMLHPFFLQRHANRTPDELGVTIVDAEGAQNLTPFALLVESFGGFWVAMVDGDSEGVSGVKKAAEALGRPLTAESDEIVMLPSPNAIEHYVLQPELRRPLTAAVAAQFGESALVEYRELHNGRPGKKGVPRDYESEGWEDRVLVDFLANNKPAWGGAFGRACCEQDEPVIPERIATLLDRVDARLGMAA